MPPIRTDSEWLRGEGDATDVVVSSRVRLARNLANVPFVNRMSPAQRLNTLNTVRARVESLGLHMTWIDLHRAPLSERTLLVERHLISLQHARGRKPATGHAGTGQTPTRPAAEEPRAVAFTSPDERLSIMVHEEDHLRIQALRSGLDLAGAMAQADDADDRLEAGLTYAFGTRFGYLTACPTNVGTGLRLSVMLHLPSLRLTGNIERVKHAAGDMNLALRGFYGEGSEAAGDFYQLSNQTTFGKSEAVLLRELTGEIIPRVLDYERAARRSLLNRRRADLEDQVFRALGVLSRARLMTTEEAMRQLSLLRLGVVCGLFGAAPDARDRATRQPGDAESAHPDGSGSLDLATVNRLMLHVQPAHLQRVLGVEMDQDRRRAARATLLRDALAGV
ncbi:MAG: ATP--guanido phosphotransferase [Phycisphaerae bacterium]|nr:ATP--guanido phosphotransferase [Phycisphaerae bacterium]